MKLRGDPIDRVDGRAKVTGTARYAADVPVAHVAHAVLILSSVAKGKVVSMDTARAQKAPGVLAVITQDNAPRMPQPDLMHKASPGDRILALFQDGQVWYANQPIGVVVADTLERAQHAAQLVDLRYDTERPQVELRPDLPAEKAVAQGEMGKQSPPDWQKGDLEAGLKSAAVKIEETYRIPYETHNPMEPHATIAVWQGRDHLTVYDSTQGIFEVRRKLSTMFNLPKENVRVISHFVGGGFGCKGSVWSHVVIAAMAARQVNRPVKLVVGRPQMFGPVGFRPANEQRITLGATRDGTLTAVRAELRAMTSRFDEFAEHTTAPVRALYACPNMQTSERLVKLDTGTPTFTRAPGESTGNFAIESAMDELAYALKMDPVALRLKNHADEDPMSGKPWSSKSLKECYQRAAETFGWAKRRREPRSMKDGNILVGWGMATATYPTHVRPAAAKVSLLPDGTAEVRAGTQDIGTGTYTIMTQIAADALGLPVERVHFDLGDTEMPEAPTSGGSVTAASVGSAVRMVCMAARQKLAELTGVTPDQVKIDGQLREILARNQLQSLDASFKTQDSEERKKYQTRSFGAQFVEVRVDPEVGVVRVARIVSAFAAGRILNAKTARSQYIGGIVWGLGMGLFEHTIYDPRLGRIMNADLAEYHVPVEADVPAIDVLFVDEEDKIVNEVGAKGIGEIGICGVPAALANAIYHATGKRVRELPITLDKVFV
jgi:xanthine dehydrogenase YagR molybdenum-binding subunit